MWKPSGWIRISSASSATQVRPTAPVLPGISGWTRTMPSTAASAVELCLQQLVDNRRVALALHGFHRLADEKAEQLVLAAAVFGDLVLVGGEDLGDHRFDRAGVALLLEALGLGDLGGGAA